MLSSSIPADLPFTNELDWKFSNEADIHSEQARADVRGVYHVLGFVKLRLLARER